ncbi:MAG: hypothetical protein LBE91_15005 [Tannerella sp.]|jgi:hypothetical protein|nr:hypothetical protein [Tannerella sp.]
MRDIEDKKNDNQKIDLYQPKYLVWLLWTIFISIIQFYRQANFFDIKYLIVAVVVPPLGYYLVKTLRD